jgi:hypothetical protein
MIARHDGVLTVPNDAVRSPREAATAATLVGLAPDSVSMSVQSQMAAASGPAPRAARPGGDTPSVAQVPGGDGARGGPAAAAGRAARTARGGSAPTGESAPAPRSRAALVFVSRNGTYEPRVIRVGATNYDFAEVLSGLSEGDKVASLAVAALQAKRDEQNSRFRSMTGGGMPGMQRQGGAAGGSGAGGGAPAGGARTP